jgi:hypothetical protein
LRAFVSLVSPERFAPPRRPVSGDSEKNISGSNRWQAYFGK